MLRRLLRRETGPKSTDPSLTDEQRRLGRKLARQRKVIDGVWNRLSKVRALLVAIGITWIFLLPRPELWKRTWSDENALQPGSVNLFYGWDDVHNADTYLATVEALRDSNATWVEKSAYLLHSLSSAGHEVGNTTLAVFARVTPPRSEGTEAILISANWLSRDGVPNVRGVSLLLSLADFLRAQNHWAFDVFLVVGDGYLHGLEDFMTAYNPRANIWTALNIDYPYHSFSHVGIFHEGVNGRLPNLDVIVAVGYVGYWGAGYDDSLHNFPANLPHTYSTGAKQLWSHFKYAMLGRPSAAHGVLAKHRIDAVTLYGVPAEGPHGFHSLGRGVEGMMRTYNNMLERLHASFFFYLLPAADRFMPVGHYLPAAVLLGASVTLGGFDCPDALAGAIWTVPAVATGLIGWFTQSPWIIALAPFLPRPEGAEAKSLLSLAHLGYGALIPTLAMVNFPQAILLAAMTLLALNPLFTLAIPVANYRVTIPLGTVVLFSGLVYSFPLIRELKGEWELFGNVAWPAFFAIIVPLCVVSWTTPSAQLVVDDETPVTQVLADTKAVEDAVKGE